MKKMTLIVLLLVVIGLVSALHATVYVTVKNVWYENGWENNNVQLVVKRSNNAIVHSVSIPPQYGHSSVTSTFVLNEGTYNFSASQHGVGATIIKYVEPYGDTYVVITLPGPWEIHNPPQND